MDIDIENNPLISSDIDRKNVLILLNLFNTKPKHFSKILTSKRNADKYVSILRWIDSKVPLLANSEYPYNICTKLNWIFHGRTSFKECGHPNCHNLIGVENDIKVNADYGEHCSRKCSATNPLQIAQIKRTKKDRYGSENFVNVEKAKRTKLERYGDPNYQNMSAIYETKRQRYGDPFYNNRSKAKQTAKRREHEDSEYRHKIVEKSKATKLKLHGDANYVNVEKQKETWKRHKEADSNFIKDRQEKIRNTTFERHGFISPFELKETREKAAQTMLDRYGVKYSGQSNEIKQKWKESIKRRLGVEHNWSDPDIRKKIEETNMKRYGTPFGPSKKRYFYHGVKFDTSFELIYFMYMELFNMPVERNTDHFFTYEHNGVLHRYFPDFKTDDGFVEIKGDHFFNDDGTMKNPFRSKDWSDEQKRDADSMYEAKHQCMIRNHVKVFTSEDIHKFAKCICENMNLDNIKSYIKQFEILK